MLPGEVSAGRDWCGGLGVRVAVDHLFAQIIGSVVDGAAILGRRGRDERRSGHYSISRVCNFVQMWRIDPAKSPYAQGCTGQKLVITNGRAAI
jgi:hypothetical protein